MIKRNIFEFQLFSKSLHFVGSSCRHCLCQQRKEFVGELRDENKKFQSEGNLSGTNLASNKLNSRNRYSMH